MKNNNEITLRIEGNMNDFKKDLVKKGYKETEHLILYDVFMVPNIIKMEELTTRQIISKAIIIRKVEDIIKSEVRKDISFKIKKYNDLGEILEQKSIRMKVLDCEEAEEFMKAIGYRSIMNIVEEDYGYKKGEMSLMIKDVKGGDKMIEVETQEDNPEFDTIDKLKIKLKDENLKLDFSDCFIKKAEVELNKILKR